MFFLLEKPGVDRQLTTWDMLRAGLLPVYTHGIATMRALPKTSRRQGLLFQPRETKHRLLLVALAGYHGQSNALWEAERVPVTRAPGCQSVLLQGQQQDKVYCTRSSKLGWISSSVSVMLMHAHGIMAPIPFHPAFSRW